MGPTQIMGLVSGPQLAQFVTYLRATTCLIACIALFQSHQDGYFGPILFPLESWASQVDCQVFHIHGIHLHRTNHHSNGLHLWVVFSASITMGRNHMFCFSGFVWCFFTI